MGYLSHVSTFAGLPVREFMPDEDISSVDPGTVAWRVATDYDRGADWFDAALAALVDAPWASQVRALIIGDWGESYDRTAPIDRLVAAADRLTGLTALNLGEMTSEECEPGSSRATSHPC